jgi:hypothetical protein
VPHHLLDIWDVTEPASVSEYQRLARAAVGDVLSRGRTPLLVGGSGLYVRAVIDNLEFPGTEPALRARLEDELATVGSPALHARLAAADPVAAAAILPSNGRRIVRALEVIELSGRPFSATLPEYASVLPATQIGLAGPRPELDQRIAERVHRMWRDGLVDEVRALAGSGVPGTVLAREDTLPTGGHPRAPDGPVPPGGLRAGRTASRALGYAQGCANSTASPRRIKRWRRQARRPGGLPAGRNPGSGATPGSAGCPPASRSRRPLRWPRSTIRRGCLASIWVMRYAKGHGTGNDFVILPDLDDRLDLGPELVRRLCDRRAGIGADGVLRVVRARANGAGGAVAPSWFMDYRNADGSVAEMCGNGVRVFARYLTDNGLAASPEIAIATRAGTRVVRQVGGGLFCVQMGPVRVAGTSWAVIGSVGRNSSTLSRSETDTTQTRECAKVATSTRCGPRVIWMRDGLPHAAASWGR